MKTHYLPLFTTTLLTLASAQSHALDPLHLNPISPWYGLDKPSGWHFELGLGLELEPDYAGSDDYATEPDALARAMYRTNNGHRVFIGLGEIGGVVSLSDDVQLMAFLEYEEERENSENSALEGLNEIDSTIEGQVTLAKRFGNASIFAVLQPDISGDANKGLVWFTGASYDSLFGGDKWRFSTSLDISGANSEYMQTEFGITPDEASRTNYAAYNPGAGLKSATWGLSLEYLFSPRLSIWTSMSTEYYLSKAADSPLINDAGRRTGIEANVIVRWQF